MKIYYQPVYHDALGQEVRIGQAVAWATKNGNSAALGFGIITDIQEEERRIVFIVIKKVNDSYKAHRVKLTNMHRIVRIDRSSKLIEWLEGQL